MGSSYEQPQSTSGRNHLQRTDLHDVNVVRLHPENETVSVATVKNDRVNQDTANENRSARHSYRQNIEAITLLQQIEK